MPRIVHLGLGAFHRAHQAVYLQRLMALGEREWTLAGGNLRPDAPDIIQALQASGGVYTLETVAPDGSRQWERITSLTEIIACTPGWTEFVRVGSDPATRIISFTVTEAGYEARGAEPPLIFEVLSLMLEARMRAGAGPVTLLCCDNLRHNGDRTRSGLQAHLRERNAGELARWVDEHTACPNTMVDRITPRPTPQVRERALQATGIGDPASLMAESYVQWVIENNFAAGRPAWERVGAELVADVSPYEEAKIRLLNAAHSCLAWAGTLAGHTFVHEDARDPKVCAIALDYATHDAIPVLRPSPVDLERYRDSVIERFRNSALADSNQRIFTDSYAKIAAFVAPTVADRLSVGASVDAVAMLPALYLACLRLFAGGRAPFEYSDQAFELAAAMRLCSAPDPVAALASDERLWGRWAGDARWVDALRRASARVAAP